MGDGSTEMKYFISRRTKYYSTILKYLWEELYYNATRQLSRTINTCNGRIYIVQNLNPPIVRKILDLDHLWLYDLETPFAVTATATQPTANIPFISGDNRKLFLYANVRQLRYSDLAGTIHKCLNRELCRIVIISPVFTIVFTLRLH